MIEQLQNELERMRNSGVYKTFPVLDSPMDAIVKLSDGRELINLCSNNYLGLANHPRVIRSAQKTMEKYGYGTASVRFICGTLDIHKILETEIAEFLGFENATTFVSCWNANEALLPTLLDGEDLLISDELNHASIIDASRLCKKTVKKLVYKHSNMDELAACLKHTACARRVMIITDGVFSMEGDLAKLPEIVDLAGKHRAMVAVDDSHAHGVLGPSGRGTPEYYNLSVDIVTGTLGKALGGAAGGFIASRSPVIEYLVQKSRPQLFSNALPASVAGGAREALHILKSTPHLVAKLHQNVEYFRNGLQELGYNALHSPSAIVPIMIGETAKAIEIAHAFRNLNIMITGFGYPVVPEGAARLRAQISACHTTEHLDIALKAFADLKMTMK